jgi:hypothetical protein
MGLYILLSLLGNNSIKRSPRKRVIVGVVLCAVRIVSKESRRLVLRISCYLKNSDVL